MDLGDDATLKAQEIGSTLRAARRERGLSIESLARSAGVAAGTVSQYERGMGNPTMQTLRRLARALDISFVQFAMSAPTDAPHPDIATRLATSRPGRVGIVRAHERHRLVLTGVGPEYEILSPDLDGALLLMHSVFKVGFDNFDQPFSHEGEEAVTLVTGRVQGRIGDTTIEIEAGDTVTFDSALPHAWRTLGTTDAAFFSAMTPPTLF